MANYAECKSCGKKVKEYALMAKMCANCYTKSINQMRYNWRKCDEKEEPFVKSKQISNIKCPNCGKELDNNNKGIWQSVRGPFSAPIGCYWCMPEYNKKGQRYPEENTNEI